MIKPGDSAVVIKQHRLNRAASTVLVATILALPALEAHSQSNDTGSEGGFLEEIIVTAQRREDRITDVPISITAFGQDEADRRGVFDVGDVARITPNLNLANVGNTISRVSIRGVDSDAGAGTTGIYVNDVPIQVRQIGFNAFDVFPLVFDLERTEVLRGPQGTLFGAGSQGGTIRFITPQANLTEHSGYARATASTTESGAPSYEAGVAFGGPIAEDKVAFRVSFLGSEQGGWIDRVREPTDALGTLETVDDDANSVTNYVGRPSKKVLLLPTS